MSQLSNNTVIDNNLRELITAVDVESDSGNYPIEKLDAHLRDIQHMAISIFVFRGSEMLLQKRADTKYHSGGLWANTVCSHPRWQESAASCAGRRLDEELGWSIPVKKFGEIVYHAQVGELYENEHVHCFYGWFDESHDVYAFNRDEVSDVKWLSIPDILQEIEQSPEDFTEWFKIYMAEYRDMIKAII
ncbi:MAG: isopentenyl-diphosphate delta-isomerase [Granulosicoccus sp.]|jgi:isopentenyl-diphosphate delta-isomerase